MNVAGWVVVGLMALAIYLIVAPAVKTYRKKRRDAAASEEAQQRAFDDWLSSVRDLQGNEDLEGLAGLGNDLPALVKQREDEPAVAEALAAVKTAKDEVKRRRYEQDELRERDKAHRLLEETRQATDTTSRIEILEEFSNYLIGLLPEDAQQEVRQLQAEAADAYVSQLLKVARGGDVEALRKLHAFVSVDIHEHARYKRLTNRNYAPPPDWNDLVAQMVEKPDLQWFYLRSVRFGLDDLEYLISEAVSKRSLTLALIAVAVMDNNEWSVPKHGLRGTDVTIERQRRKTVNPVLRAQLSELLADLKPVSGSFVP